MYSSLLSIKEKYDNYTKQLNEPNIFNDIKKYNQINKEKSDIEDIYHNFLAYLQAEESYNLDKDIISNEQDEELILLAKDDALNQEQSKTEIHAPMTVVVKENPSEREIARQQQLQWQKAAYDF